MLNRDDGNIESIRFIPPRLGEDGDGFGCFKVTYKMAVLRKTTAEELLKSF